MMRKIFIIALFMLVLLGTALNAASWSLILRLDIPVVATVDGSTIALDNDIYLKRWNGLTLDRVQDGAYLITDRDGYSLLIFTEDAPENPYETGWTLERYGADAEAVIFQGTLPDTDALEYADPMRILSTKLLSSRKIWEFRQLGHSLKAIPRFSTIHMDDGRMTIRSERDTVTCPYCHRSFTPVWMDGRPFRPDQGKPAHPWNGYDDDIRNPWA